MYLPGSAGLVVVAAVAVAPERRAPGGGGATRSPEVRVGRASLMPSSSSCEASAPSVFIAPAGATSPGVLITATFQTKYVVYTPTDPAISRRTHRRYVTRYSPTTFRQSGDHARPQLSDAVYLPPAPAYFTCSGDSRGRLRRQAVAASGITRAAGSIARITLIFSIRTCTGSLRPAGCCLGHATSWLLAACLTCPPCRRAGSAPVGIAFAQSGSATAWCRDQELPRRSPAHSPNVATKPPGRLLPTRGARRQAGRMMVAWLPEFHATVIVCGTPAKRRASPP